MVCLYFSAFVVLCATMIIPVAVGDEEMRRLKKKRVIK